MQQIIFILLVGFSFFFAGKQFLQIYKNIQLGRADTKTINPAVGLRQMLLVAFGQQKMFKRWIPAVLHLFIYVAFLFTQIELVEILVDGFFGVHRFFAPYLGGFYTFLISFIEILSVLAFIGTVAFLVRRNILKTPRLHKPEMKGWPTTDANIILILEVVLLIGIFSMNGADILLQDKLPASYPDTGALAISSISGPLFFGGLSTETLMVVERGGWWLHLIAVLGFLNYLPKSKHLHILLAFPNTYLTSDTPKGQMENMPEIMNEVKSMMDPDAPIPEEMEELPTFGANDIFTLSQKNLLEAYTCTECGRCTDNCPANITGKKLSPRKVMMDVRDRIEEVSLNLQSGKLEFISAEKREQEKVLTAANYDDGKDLFSRITKEELHACTTCNACVEACPVLINPLDIIAQMRRYEILTLSEGPQELLSMYNSVEQNGSVWAMGVSRESWRNQLDA